MEPVTLALGAGALWLAWNAIKSKNAPASGPLPSAVVSSDGVAAINNALQTGDMNSGAAVWASGMAGDFGDPSQPQLKMALDMLGNAITAKKPVAVFTPASGGMTQYRRQVISAEPDGTLTTDLFTATGTRILRYKQTYTPESPNPPKIYVSKPDTADMGLIARALADLKIYGQRQ